MKKIFTLLFLSLQFLSFGQQSSEITVSADTLNIRIGEQIQYSIAVTSDKKVDFPVIENLDSLEVVQEFDAQKIKNALVKKYLITGFDSGSFYIKKQAVYIDNKAYFTDSLLVNVATVKVDTMQQPAYGVTQLYDAPVGLIELKYHTKKYGPYVLVIVLVPLALLLLSRLLNDKKKKPVKKKKIIPAYQLAQQQFQELTAKNLWQENQVKEYYSELTEIVRAYIGNELKLHTLELTTEELIALLNNYEQKNQLGLSKKKVVELQALLKQADFVKFAKQKPVANEIQIDEQTAKSVVEEIHELVKQKQPNVGSDFANEENIEEETTENSKKSKLKDKLSLKRILIFIVSFGLAYFIAYYITSNLLEKSEVIVSEVMLKVTSEINESCPIMVDQDTRLDNTVVLGEKTFRYNYTLVNLTKDTIDTNLVKQSMEPLLLNAVKTEPSLKPLRDLEMIINYHYKDKEGVYLFDVSITPEMYKE